MIVIDASVATKWLLSEPGSTEARQLLEGDGMMLAPAVVHLEVTGAIVRGFRQSRLTELESRQAFALWGELLQGGALQLVPIDDLYPLAFDLALKLKHPLVDCFYLAAGKQLGMPVLTADRRLYDRGKQLRHKTSLLPGIDQH